MSAKGEPAPGVVDLLYDIRRLTAAALYLLTQDQRPEVMETVEDLLQELARQSGALVRAWDAQPPTQP